MRDRAGDGIKPRMSVIRDGMMDTAASDSGR